MAQQSDAQLLPTSRSVDGTPHHHTFIALLTSFIILLHSLLHTRARTTQIRDPAQLRQQARELFDHLCPAHRGEVPGVEEVLADVRLQEEEHGAVGEAQEQFVQEEFVLQQPEPEPVQDDEGPEMRGGHPSGGRAQEVSVGGGCGSGLDKGCYQ